MSHVEINPRSGNPQRNQLTAALTSKISNQQLATFDLEFLQDLQSGKVLENLKKILQLAEVDASSSDRAIRLPEVLRLLGIGKSTWYERLNAKSASYDPYAPKPFKLGNSDRSPTVWWQSEVLAYLAARATVSRAEMSCNSAKVGA
ncbi:MAG: AlpA family phage regulatory protein [Pseudoxanthomonas sp.]